jgi:arylsulfatase B
MVRWPTRFWLDDFTYRGGANGVVIVRIAALLLLVPLTLNGSVFAQTETVPAARPNIVVIVADDLGWADVSYHAERADTPNIDRLAKEGIELDRFYVAPMCSPTRAGLLTGRYPIRFGLARSVIPPYRDHGLPSEELTLPEVLAAGGYRHRAIFGKWHLGHLRAKWHPLRQGFTHFRGHYNGAIGYFNHERDGERDWHVDWKPSDEEGYSTDLIADHAARFIREHTKGKEPYFCYVPFNAPHAPFDAKKEDIARYVDADRRGRNAARQRQLAMIWSLDQSIGKLLEAVEASGEADNTIVWFMSDNGGLSRFPNSNRPLRGAKLSVFEGGIRAAACVRWPGKWQGGRKVTEPLSHIDVMPTLLAAAGVDANADADRPFDGIDIGPLLGGEVDSLAPRDLYAYHGQSGPQREQIAITTPEWKLIVEGPDLSRVGVTDAHEIHLFRFPEDLREQNNVAREHPQVAEELTEKLIAFRELQPADGVPPYSQGRRGFTPPENWRLSPED